MKTVIDGHPIFHELSDMARIITVTSGKGGVGKTTISANLAIGLAGQGFRTCLFDGDLSLADISILFGIYPEHNLEDLVFNHMGFGDILIRDQGGIDIVPGSSRNENMADLAPEKIEHIVRCLQESADAYDFIIIDTAPGISRQVVSFCMAASDIILILSPESTSFIDSYGLLKVLRSKGYDGTLWAAFNRVDHIQDAERLFSKFREKINDFLSVKIDLLGSVVQDKYVREALKQQRPNLLRFPNSGVSKCIENLVRMIAPIGGCTPKPFVSKSVRSRSADIFKKNLHGVKTGWNLLKQIVFPPPANGENKPVRKFLSTDEIRPLAGNPASHSDLPLAGPPRGAERWSDHSKTRVASPGTAICEATLIPLDFEAFAECRATC